MRKLNVLVAERVMEWTFADETPHPEYRQPGQKTALWYRAPGGMLYCIPPDGEKVFPSIPHGDWSPSTDIAAAFMAEWQMSASRELMQQYTDCLAEIVAGDSAGIYETAIELDGYDFEMNGHAFVWLIAHATPEQRCIAMLWAKGVSQDEIDATMKQEVSA